MPAVAEASRLRTEEIREHYNDFSWIYRTYWGEHIHHGLFRNGNETPRQAQELLIRHCAGLVQLRPGMKVADVGCGYGATARFLAREHACEVLGLTISEVQLRTAIKGAQALAGPYAVRFELADAENFVFPAAHFDVVWNMESSEHFFDKPAYFRNAAAALKPGGRLLLAAWTGSMRQELVRRIAEIFLCPELLTAKDYAAQIRRARLRVLHAEDIGLQVARTWDLCARYARMATPALAAMPQKYRGFAQGIELMREAFRSGLLNYTILVAER